MEKKNPVLLECAKMSYMTSEYVRHDGSYYSSAKELKEDVWGRKEYYVLFCPECGEGSRVDDYRFNALKEREDDAYPELDGICPRCGKRVSGWGHFDEDISQYWPIIVNGTKVALVSSRKSPMPGNVFFSEEEDKLVFTSEYFHVSALCVKGRYYLRKSPFYYRIIFNLKSGLSYVMRPVDAGGEPVPDAFTRRLTSMSFACNYGWPLLWSPASAPQTKAVISVLRKYFPEAEDLRLRDMSVSDFSRLNYLKGLKTSDIRDLLCCADGDFRIPNSITEGIRRIRKCAREEDFSCLPKYMQKKSIKRRLTKRMAAYFIYRWLYRADIKDVNVMNAVVDEILEKDNLIESVRSVFGMSEAEKSFVSWAKEGRGPKSLKALLSDVLEGSFESRLCLHDAATMLSDLEDLGIEEIDRRGSLKEIHDRLSVLERRIESPNRKIEYEEDERALEEETDGFSFKLAENTDALFEIGDDMDICVGSYGNAAVKKRCTILTMEKDGKNLACIELRRKGRGFEMVQLKAKCNETVTEFAPVKAWAENHNIYVEDCGDYCEAAAA